MARLARRNAPPGSLTTVALLGDEQIGEKPLGMRAAQAGQVGFDQHLDRVVRRQAHRRQRRKAGPRLVLTDPLAARSRRADPHQPKVVSSAKGSHRFEARAGHHRAPAVPSCGANVYERLGPGFTLLAFDAQPDAVRAFQDAADESDVPLTVVEDRAEGEAARYEAKLVRVRPDQFVAWSACQGQAKVEEVRRLLNVA